MLPAPRQRHYKVILKSFMVRGGWFNHEILCLGRLFPGPVMTLNLDTSSFYHEWFLKCNEWIQEFGVGTVRWWFLLNIEGAQKSFINNWMCVHVICRRPKLNICVTSDIVGGHGSHSLGLPSSNTGTLGYCPDGSKHHIWQWQNKHRPPTEADKRSFSNFICKTLSDSMETVLLVSQETFIMSCGDWACGKNGVTVCFLVLATYWVPKCLF